jgi:hypothetical protein
MRGLGCVTVTGADAPRGVPAPGATAHAHLHRTEHRLRARRTYAHTQHTASRFLLMWVWVMLTWCACLPGFIAGTTTMEQVMQAAREANGKRPVLD